MRAFGSEPEVLVDREIQNRLRAIEAIQLEKRRAIAAALVSGAARTVDGELEMEDRQASWAKDFWRAPQGPLKPFQSVPYPGPETQAVGTLIALSPFALVLFCFVSC